VVEQLRKLPFLLVLELRDRAGAARARLDHGRRRPLLEPLPTEITARVEAFSARLEAGLHEPVRLGLEVSDLQLSRDDQRERRRLYAAQRDRAVERGTQADRRRPGGVHADEPVGFGTRARGRL